jgi:protein-disulfide isomerase
VIKNYPYKYRDFARISAKASLAARDQGKYWEMHDLLLSRSPKLDRMNLLQYAGELGLDLTKFTAALDGPGHDPAIDADLKLAESLDLFNTPTFYLNGRQLIGGRPLADLKKLVDEELRRKGE